VDAIVGDGNCFYRAVSHVITGSQQFHHELREHCATFFSLHEDVFGEYNDRNNQYITPAQVRTLGHWAGQVEIYTFATILQTTFALFTQQGPTEQWAFIHPIDLATRNISEAPPGRPHIYFHHKGRAHYDVVRQLQ
jgi:hypothetical protein